MSELSSHHLKQLKRQEANNECLQYAENLTHTISTLPRGSQSWVFLFYRTQRFEAVTPPKFTTGGGTESTLNTLQGLPINTSLWTPLEAK